MPRPILVVDASLSFLEPPLKEANLRVVVPRDGTLEPVIKSELLPHRILVTRNTEGFLDDAPIHEYGIIGLEGLPLVDMASELAQNETAKLISRAVSGFDLGSHRTGVFADAETIWHAYISADSVTASGSHIVSLNHRSSDSRDGSISLGCRQSSRSATKRLSRAQSIPGLSC
jgi:hypothetical protein